MWNKDRGRQTAVTWGVVLGLALLSLPYVFSEAFSDLQRFDDQGVLMIAFRDLLSGYVPYREVFLLYGPFYYVTLTPLFDCPLLGFKPSSSRRNCFSTKSNRRMLTSLESWTPPLGEKGP